MTPIRFNERGNRVTRSLANNGGDTLQNSGRGTLLLPDNTAPVTPRAKWESRVRVSFGVEVPWKFRLDRN